MKCHSVADVADFSVVPAAAIFPILHPEVRVCLLMQIQKVSLWNSISQRRHQHGVQHGISVK